MKITSLLLLTLSLTLSACHSNVRSSSPTLFTDGVQLHQKRVTIDEQHAKVTMRSSGFTFPVEFSVRRSADPDQRMEVLGKVVDSGRGKVFGWIANMNETSNSALLKRFPQLEILADPDQSLLVSGYSVGAGNGYTYRCGPLNTTFTPERKKVYLVEFQFVGDRCQQKVYDITHPKQRIPVVDASAPPSQV